MARCAKCGTALSEEELFCHRCGAAVLRQDGLADLQKYIEESTAQGLSVETIRKRLLDAGWENEAVKKALLPAIPLPAGAQKRQYQKNECATCGKKLLWWWYWGIPIWIVAEVGPKRFCGFGCRQAFLKDYHEMKRKQKG